MKVLSAGLRTYEVPPDFSGNDGSWCSFILMNCAAIDCVFFSLTDVVLPEKPKLKFLEKVPNLKQAKKEMKKLRDIQGPAKSATTFTKGQYGIVVRIFASYFDMVHVCK